MNPYVFISYAHKDKKEVVNSIDALRSFGVNLWYDAGIKAGSDWASEIGTNLKEASAMLLFLSRSSAKSKNVRREIEFAMENSIPILTIQIGSFKMPEDLGKILSVNQFIRLDAFRTYKTFAAGLCTGLERYGVISGNESECSEIKIKLKQKRAGMVVLISIFAALVLAVCFMKFFVGDIPNVVGKEAFTAENDVNSAGFDCAVSMDYSEDEDYGFIFDQSKKGSGFKNSTVLIYESLGPSDNLTEVPDLVGFHISEGIAKLLDAGMHSFVIAPVSSTEYDIAYITGQSISPHFKVSARNRIELKVSSSVGTEIKILGKKIKLTDQKLEIKIDENDEISLTPLNIYGITADYSESLALNKANTINADFDFNMKINREDTDYYGKYRGSFDVNCEVEESDSIMYKLAKFFLADDDGKVRVRLSSSSFNCEAEEYDEEKYLSFVKDNTGSSENAPKYKDPVMMVLGKDVVLTDMNLAAGNIKKLYWLGSRLVFSLPRLEADVLTQPFSIIAQANGKVYIAFYGKKGGNGGQSKVMEFHGNLSY